MNKPFLNTTDIFSCVYSFTEATTANLNKPNVSRKLPKNANLI